jgi:hypothetical protein
MHTFGVLQPDREFEPATEQARPVLPPAFRLVAQIRERESVVPVLLQHCRPERVDQDRFTARRKEFARVSARDCP